MRDTDCDVLIVGGGPVGFTLAHLMGQLGHRVEVAERHLKRYPLPRAIVFDYEAMRLFRRIGLAAQAEALGRRSMLYQWFAADWTLLWTFDFSVPSPCGGALNYTFHQPSLEAAIEAALAARPTVRVNRGWEATALAQSDAAATVTLERDGVRRSLTARWVVGADGANSFVRQASGIALRDLGFRADWLVVDVRPLPGTTIAVPEAAQWCNPARPVTLVPGGGCDRRWEFMLLPGESWEEMQAPARIWSLLAPWVAEGQATLLRHAVYRFSSALAERWRAGRVLLAGDAAHLMPPFMGQGMNSGLRDAANLAWKLDRVLRGQADAALLDSYEAERRAQVSDVIDLSVEMGQVACIADHAIAAARDAAFLAGHVPAAKPFPGLREGLLYRREDGTLDPFAGAVSVHGEVSHQGAVVWPDDLAGTELLSVTVGDAVPDEIGVLLASLGTWLHLGPAGNATDLTGRYVDYLGTNGLVGLIVRPDGYLFGTAGDWTSLARMAEQARQKCGSAVPTRGG